MWLSYALEDVYQNPWPLPTIAGDNRHTQISKSIKLLVKMKNVSVFYNTEKTKQTFLVNPILLSHQLHNTWSSFKFPQLSKKRSLISWHFFKSRIKSRTQAKKVDTMSLQSLEWP